MFYICALGINFFNHVHVRIRGFSDIPKSITQTLKNFYIVIVIACFTKARPTMPCISLVNQLKVSLGEKLKSSASPQTFNSPHPN